MKKTSKLILALILGFVIFTTLIFSVGVATNVNADYVARIIYDTKLYSEIPIMINGEVTVSDDENGNPRVSESIIIAEIKKNEEIAIISETEYKVNDKGDGIFASKEYTFRKIKFSNKEGYVFADMIYFSPNTQTNKIDIMRTKSSKLGEQIPVYASYEKGAEIITYLTDGQKVNVVVQDNVSFGDKTRILYNNGFVYINTNNLTFGLSLNQTIAIIVLSVTIGVTIIIFVVIALIKRRKKKVVE